MYIRPWKRKVYALVCYNFDCFHCTSNTASAATINAAPGGGAAMTTPTHPYKIQRHCISQDSRAPFCSNFRFIDVSCIHHCSEVWCCSCCCCNDNKKQKQQISCISSTHFYFTFVCVMYFRLSAKNLWKTFENVFAIKVPATQTKSFEQNGVYLVYFLHSPSNAFCRARAQVGV